MAYPGYIFQTSSAGSGLPGSMLLAGQVANRLKPGLPDGISGLYFSNFISRIRLAWQYAAGRAGS
jgi:hypothetical protein